MSQRKKLFAGAAAAVAMLFVLAVAIPNWQRSRMTGCPATPAAAGAMNVRSIITSQITYATMYPRQGYARNLAVMGSDGPDYAQCHPRPDRACLLDQKVGCPSGTGTAWCVAGSYRFNVQSSSSEPPYKDYWITATPVRADPELKNLCSGPDAVVRHEGGSPLSQPYSTLEECLAMESASKF
jgi:hypothetical protein